MDGELHRHSMVVDRHGACVLGVTEPDWLRGMGSSHTGLLCSTATSILSHTHSVRGVVGLLILWDLATVIQP